MPRQTRKTTQTSTALILLVLVRAAEDRRWSFVRFADALRRPTFGLVSTLVILLGVPFQRD